MGSVSLSSTGTRGILLLACLASLRKFPYPGPFQIIVVDNHSSDGSVEAVRTAFPEVLLLALHMNTGYARGNNAGFQHAEQPFVLTLNPDTEVVDDSLRTAVDVLRSYPRAAAIGVKQVTVKGSTQSSVRGFPSFRASCDTCSRHKGFLYLHPSDQDRGRGAERVYSQNSAR